jgi:hypothetical protein
MNNLINNISPIKANMLKKMREGDKVFINKIQSIVEQRVV